MCFKIGRDEFNSEFVCNSIRVPCTTLLFNLVRSFYNINFKGINNSIENLVESLNTPQIREFLEDQKKLNAQIHLTSNLITPISEQIQSCEDSIKQISLMISKRFLNEEYKGEKNGKDGNAK